jgi:hypothetical protein
MLNWAAKEYKNPPVLVAENGFSDHGEVNDIDRVDYYIVSGSISRPLSKSVTVCVLELIYRNPSE